MATRLLSAGAAKGLVTSLEAEFRAATGATIDGSFSAVGAIRERFLSGEPCDVLILTTALVAALTRDGLLRAGSAAPIGLVRTAVAVPAGQPAPDIASGDALRASLLAADALYVPDTARSTAGGHVLAVLRKLGIEDAMASRLRAFPNGETAMRTLAADAAPGSVGCTQTTEIRNTPGLALVGPLPAGYDLSTVYSAAIGADAADADLARRLVALLTGLGAAELRARLGFEPADAAGGAA